MFLKKIECEPIQKKSHAHKHTPPSFLLLLLLLLLFDGDDNNTY